MNTKRFKLLSSWVVLLAIASIQPTYAFYNPNSGRWLSRDPIGELGSLNLHLFVNNNAIMQIDELGLWPHLVALPASPPVIKYFCGGFDYRIIWYLDQEFEKSDPTAGGVIVQKVTAAFNVTYCDGRPFALPPLPPNAGPNVNPAWWPVYEAWRIPPGERRATTTSGPNRRNYDDHFSMSEFPTCTRGTISFNAVADYFDGYGIPVNFIGNNPVAGILPNAGEFIEPAEGATSSVTRSLVATWDCCSGRKKTAVSVNGVPQ